MSKIEFAYLVLYRTYKKSEEVITSGKHDLGWKGALTINHCFVKCSSLGQVSYNGM